MGGLAWNGEGEKHTGGRPRKTGIALDKKIVKAKVAVLSLHKIAFWLVPCSSHCELLRWIRKSGALTKY